MPEQKTANSDYLLTELVAVQPGQPYRLLPLGKMVKNGKTRELTADLLAKFRLPHFKPPVKLGSHAETTPAGGHITGLEVRADGLYAIPELNEQGAQAIENGSYRYHSPEVIWEDGGMEDPQTGETIAGPMIVGDALLHTPHLGEAAALYQVEPMEVKMSEQFVQVPTSFWDKFMAKLFPDKPEPEPKPPEPDNKPDLMEAVVKERDELKAEVEKIKAEEGRKVRLDKFTAELKETKVAEGAEFLVAMTDEQSAWVIQQFKALSEQIKTGDLLGEQGSGGEGPSESPVNALDAAIKARQAEKKIDYMTALNELRDEKPELFTAAY